MPINDIMSVVMISFVPKRAFSPAGRSVHAAPAAVPKMSDTVNAAHRIEELGHALMQDTDTALVLASEATYEAAGSPADFEIAGEFTLRGRAERVSVYRLRADADAPQDP